MSYILFKVSVSQSARCQCGSKPARRQPLRPGTGKRSGQGRGRPTRHALHRQCKQQARQQGKFDVAGTPAEYLEWVWDDVQRARVAAEEALAAAETEAETLKRTRDVLILRLLADKPRLLTALELCAASSSRV